MIIFQCHGNDGDIDIDILLLLAGWNLRVFCLNRHTGGLELHPTCLATGLVGLFLIHHDLAEDAEEDKEKGQTREHDTHGENGDTESVGIVTLQTGDLRLVDLDVVADAGGDSLRRLDVPLLLTVLDAGIRLILCQYGYGDGVDQVDAVTVVQRKPKGLSCHSFCGEVHGTLGGVGMKEQDEVIAPRHLGTGITVGDYLHLGDALRSGKRGIEHTTIGGDVHTPDVVCGERGVHQFHPRQVLSEFVLQTGGIVG